MRAPPCHTRSVTWIAATRQKDVRASPEKGARARPIPRRSRCPRGVRSSVPGILVGRANASTTATLERIRRSAQRARAPGTRRCVVGRHSNADTTVGLTARPTDRRRDRHGDPRCRAHPATRRRARRGDAVAAARGPGRDRHADDGPGRAPGVAGATRRPAGAGREGGPGRAAVARRAPHPSGIGRRPEARVSRRPAPRSPDPSVSGPLAIGALATARPPWMPGSRPAPPVGPPTPRRP